MCCEGYHYKKKRLNSPELELSIQSIGYKVLSYKECANYPNVIYSSPDIAYQMVQNLQVSHETMLFMTDYLISNFHGTAQHNKNCLAAKFDGILLFTCCNSPFSYIPT